MFGNMMGDFENDPFFADFHRDRMRFGFDPFPDPFLGFDRRGGGGGLRDREEPSERRRHRDQPGDRREAAVQPFGRGLFDDMFGNMDRMMRDFHDNFNRMSTMAADNDNVHSYSHSSVMNYSNLGDGKEPKYYQATASTRKAPGGIKETRRSLRDSESGVEKMAIGHYIRDRGHVMERSRNKRSGEEKQNQDFINMREEEARDFDRQWQSGLTSSASRPAMPGISGYRDDRRRRRHGGLRAREEPLEVEAPVPAPTTRHHHHKQYHPPTPPVKKSEGRDEDLTVQGYSSHKPRKVKYADDYY